MLWIYENPFHFFHIVQAVILVIGSMYMTKREQAKISLIAGLYLHEAIAFTCMKHDEAIVHIELIRNAES